MAPVPRRLICSALTVLCVVPLLDAADGKSKPPSTQQGREVIRDRFGRMLGEIRSVGSGRLEARDRYGRLLGRYDPKSNETRDPYGRLLTKGNTLSALILKAAESKRK